MSDTAQDSGKYEQCARALWAYRDKIRETLQKAAKEHWSAEEILAKANRIDKDSHVDRFRGLFQRDSIPERKPKAGSLSLFETEDETNQPADDWDDEIGYPLG